MNKKKALNIYSTILILLLILFIVNKYYLRPNFGDIYILKEIIGSLPNLIGAFIFSLLPIDRALKISYRKGKMIIYLSSMIVFLILIIEEFFPFLTATKTFDKFDIIATGIGSLLAIIFYNYVSSRIKKIESNDLIK